jgi:hypothetical protein
VRQTIAILFLAIHLFAIGGYRWAIDEMEAHNNRQVSIRLDHADYDEANLIEIKIPLAVTYPSNWTSLERYDGEIDFNNQHYRYVKRKLVNDSLVFYCIPNQEKRKFNSARDQFFSLVNDINQEDNHSSPVSKASVVKSITAEYPTIFIHFDLNTPQVIHQKLGFHPNATALDTMLEAPYLPPKSVC